jgi:hypothetical protein
MSNRARAKLGFFVKNHCSERQKFVQITLFTTFVAVTLFENGFLIGPSIRADVFAQKPPPPPAHQRSETHAIAYP